MTPSIIKPINQLSKVVINETDISNEIKLNYSKVSLDKKNNITSINIDKAVDGKFELANTKTYTQNLVKKYDLTGNKEVCIRKIFITKREDNLFDITVRELNIYFRKAKKHHFNKVIRFRSHNGSIEYILNILKNKSNQKNITFQSNYLLA